MLFNNRPHDKIHQLPDVLKGSFVFQLPYKKVPNGTIFKIKSEFSSADIYVAHRPLSGWDENSFSRDDDLSTSKSRWERIPGEIVLKPNQQHHAPFLSYIWHRKIEPGIPVELPMITYDETFAAIFLVQGKNINRPKWIVICFLFFSKEICCQRHLYDSNYKNY